MTIFNFDTFDCEVIAPSIYGEGRLPCPIRPLTPFCGLGPGEATVLTFNYDGPVSIKEILCWNHDMTVCSSIYWETVRRTDSRWTIKVVNLSDHVRNCPLVLKLG